MENAALSNMCKAETVASSGPGLGTRLSEGPLWTNSHSGGLRPPSRFPDRKSQAGINPGTMWAMSFTR